ncbi:MAG: hypothetical protein HY343_09940 [Lentisphaerae bacterium]|nr:hypothetical protein [Lentisphaerota bacterium]
MRRVLYRLMIGGAAGAFLLSTGLAADTPQLSFSRPVDLPGVGLSFKLMPGALEELLPSPNVYTFTVTPPGGTAFKTNWYSVTQLWQHSQFTGAWGDMKSNHVVLAVVRQPYPLNLKQAFVSRADFRRAMVATPPVEASSISGDALARWALPYTGAETMRAERLVNPPSGLSDVFRFVWSGQKNRLAYAFRLNRHAAGQYEAPTNWFFLRFDVHPAMAPERARIAVEDYFLPHVTVAGALPQAPVTPLAADSGSPELADSRRHVADSIRNMKDWWFAETRHYILLSNLKNRRNALVDVLEKNLDRHRAVCERLVPSRKPITAVSVIRIFATRAEFFEYVGHDANPSMVGVWRSDRRELVIRPADAAEDRTTLDTLIRVAYHEAFHQYLFYAFNEVNASVWFNEGHAELLFAAEFGAGRAASMEHAAHVRTIEPMMLEKNFSLRPLLGMTSLAFYDTNQELMNRNYSLAWALVYYLRKSALDRKDFPYAGLLKQYEEALWKTRNGPIATETAFKDVDFKALEKDFMAFWRTEERRNTRGIELGEGAGSP